MIAPDALRPQVQGHGSQIEEQGHTLALMPLDPRM
jgi:hypothetical protein